MSAESPSQKRLVLAILVLILSLGAALRIYRLGYQSLWNDELSSWTRSSYDTLAEVMDEGVRPDVHPPAFHILLYFVEQTIGDSEEALRLPSAIFGALSILAIYAVGRRLYSDREGLIAAALMAVLLQPIFLSQDARSYAMLVLFSLIATFFWLGIVSRLHQGGRPTALALGAYAGSAIITSYIHYFGLLFIGLQATAALLLFLRQRRATLTLLALYGTILLAYLPWLPTMVAQISAGNGDWIARPDASAPLSYLAFLFNDASWIVLIVAGLYAYLLGHDIVMARKGPSSQTSRWPFHPDALVALWLLVPFIVVFLVSIVWQPILVDRYLVVSMPAAYLLLARAITQLPVRPRLQNVAALLLVGLFLWHLFFRVNYYTSPQKEQVREAVGYVVDRAPIYYDSMIIGYAWSPEYVNYYLEKKGSEQRVAQLAGEQKDVPAVLKAIQERTPRYVWVISVHRVPEQSFLDSLADELTPLDHVSFQGAQVWLFERR